MLNSDFRLFILYSKLYVLMKSDINIALKILFKALILLIYKGFLFKILIKFIRENLPIEKPNSQFDFNGTERNFLPHYSSHFGINYQEVLQYAKILDNNTN